MIYLDNAATTPMSPAVKQAVWEAMDHFGNASSIHGVGRKAKALLEGARRDIAKAVGALPAEIIFTSGGTEADNMAVTTAIQYLGVKRLISSPIEHHAISHTVEKAADRYGVSLEWVALLDDGSIDLRDLEAKLAAGPKALVSLMHANNEIGNILDVQSVSALCKQYNALFHSDMVQTFGHYALDVHQLGVDMASCAAHKFHGPKGVGFFYIRKGLNPGTFMEGGGQERGHRSGTENIPGIVGLAAALKECMEQLEADHTHFRALKSYAIEKLSQAFPTVEFNGQSGTSKGLLTVLNVLLPPTERAASLLFDLDLAGIAISGGSACSSGSNTGSHVIKALKRDLLNRPSVRISFSRYNTFADVDALVDALERFYTSVPASEAR
jgi:cysteine desulfurase